MKEQTTLITKKEDKLYKGGFSLKQLIAFYIGCGFWGVGFIFLILGLIGDYADIASNPFKTLSNYMVNFFHFGLTMTWFGVLLLCVGAVIIAFSLSLSSKNEERVKERQMRKSERLEAIKKNLEESNVVIDAETSTLENNK